MVQKTVVIKLSKDEQGELRERLSGGTFEYRSVPHAQFSVKGEGVSATLYSSGKLVVQGAEPELFLGRYVEGGKRSDKKSASRGSTGSDIPELPEPRVGSDEAGKGDYFGPLVVVALRARVGDVEELRRAGVADSKTLTDERAHVLSGFLRERYEHRIVKLAPQAYNERYEPGRLNSLLADMHAEAIRALAEDGDQVLVDRFASERLMKERLEDIDIELHQRTRAEGDPVVAAASIIARDEFVRDLDELSESSAVDLHKGAGALTDEAGRRFVELHGEEGLARVAKLHFRNTRKILA